MKIKNAKFYTSVASSENILNLGFAEFAFVGRSNCGKSSLINSLTNVKNLAKTSSTPGLTKLINYFLINFTDKEIKALNKPETHLEVENKCVFIDLPGYGYSKAGMANHVLWSRLIEDYFIASQNLACVYVLMDIRHEPSELDKQMIIYLYSKNIPFKVIATKCDKVAKSKINSYLSVIAKSLKITVNNIIACSSETKYNLDAVLSSIDAFLVK